VTSLTIGVTSVALDWREHNSQIAYLTLPFFLLTYSNRSQKKLATGVFHAEHNIMLPLPINALERSSAQALSLISGYFPWIKSSGILHQDRPEIALDNSRFIDIVLLERFKIQRRKLTHHQGV